MEINVSAEAKHTRISLDGRLEATQAATLNDAVQKALREGPPNLILDCIKLSYVASMGLRCFLMAHKGALGAGGKLDFVGLNANVRSVLAMTGFDKIAQVRDSLEDAIAYIG